MLYETVTFRLVVERWRLCVVGEAELCRFCGCEIPTTGNTMRQHPQCPPLHHQSLLIGRKAVCLLTRSQVCVRCRRPPLPCTPKQPDFRTRRPPHPVPVEPPAHRVVLIGMQTHPPPARRAHSPHREKLALAIASDTGNHLSVRKRLLHRLVDECVAASHEICLNERAVLFFCSSKKIANKQLFALFILLCNANQRTHDTPAEDSTIHTHSSLTLIPKPHLSSRPFPGVLRCRCSKVLGATPRPDPA